LSCQQTHELIHGFVDREVDLVKSLEVEKHLLSCEACARTYNELRNLQSVVRNSALRFEPPVSLERRLLSSLRQEDESKSKTVSFPWRWVLAGASLLAVAILVWVFAAISSKPSDDVLAQEVVSSHVRSLMADHLTDVPSSDQHTVKPWFDGKLDFSPNVKDLTPQGFSLTGGRLDYIGNRPIAALIYQRRQHIINVFVWPSNGTQKNEKASVRQGYNLISWTNVGLTYWAVSDLNLAELQQFAQLLQE